MQGRVDLSFRVRGDNDKGTIYFTSIRARIGDQWRICGFTLSWAGEDAMLISDGSEIQAHH